MTSNDKDFFGIRVSPVDLLATVLNDALANQAGTAKSKVRDFDPQTHLDNIFTAGQEFFGGFMAPGAPEQKKTTVVEFTPAVDVLESETGVTYLVGAPGVHQDEVTVELEDTKLTITINSGNIILADQPTHNWKGGTWGQSFSIPTGNGESPKKIDEEDINATVANGLITVNVSYKAPVVTKIKVG